MTRRQRTSKGERGVTLIETLIATLLTVIIGGATMEFYVTQHKTWLMQSEASDVQQNARACLDGIATTLLMAGYRVGSHPAVKARPDSLFVYYRNEPAGDMDTVIYFVSNADPKHPALMRQIKSGTPEVFGENIESLTVSQVSARLLQVAVTARAAKPDSSFIAGDGYRRRVYTTEVHLRNL